MEDVQVLKDRITALEAALSAEIRTRLECRVMLERASAELQALKELHKEESEQHELLKRRVGDFSSWLATHLPYKNITDPNPIRDMFRRIVRY